MIFDPKHLLAEIGSLDGKVVVDVGTGSGNFALAAAERVGSGRVYAIDIQRELLDRLAQTAREEHVSNIETLWSDVEQEGGLPLRDGIAQVILVINILFQIKDKALFAREVTRLLAPGGKLLLSDWTDSFGGLGPYPDHIVPPHQAREYFENEGLSVETELSPGDHHYGFILKKQV